MNDYHAFKSTSGNSGGGSSRGGCNKVLIWALVIYVIIKIFGR